LQIELKTIAKTKETAKKLAKALTGNEILLLYGGLASGKTTFVKYLAGALGFDESMVSSPSFTIINFYPHPEKSFGLHHIDLYRLNENSNLEPLGLDSLLDSAGLVVVEWPELGEHIFMNSPRSKIKLSFELDKGRRILSMVSGPFRNG
jgi:tRNA threonylcarbamoyladenosine biosynthesis protein TsaE